jgi:hypothetical protein
MGTQCPEIQKKKEEEKNKERRKRRRLPINSEILLYQCLA